MRLISTPNAHFTDFHHFFYYFIFTYKGLAYSAPSTGLLDVYNVIKKKLLKEKLK